MHTKADLFKMVPETQHENDPLLETNYPAKQHARRVAQNLASRGIAGKGLIYLESQKTRLLEDSDTPEIFRYRR